MPDEDTIEKLNEYFKDAHKNKGFVDFVCKFKAEVEDADTFINSMNDEEINNFFRLMLLSMQEGEGNHETYHQIG